MMKYLFSILFLGCFAISSFAQETSDPAATKLLNTVSEQYNSYATIEAKFTLKIEVPGEEYVPQKGLLAQAGDKFRLEMPDQTIVSDGVSNWIYLAGNNEIQINDVDPDDESGLLTPKELLRRYEKGDYIYALTNVSKENGRLLSQVEFKPVDRDSEYSKIRVSIDKKTNQIKRIKVFAKDGSRYTFNVTSLTPNKKFAPRYFTMDTKKYEGAHVEDLRF